MQKDKFPEGCFRIIIADLKDERILLDERAACIIGGIARIKDESKGIIETRCMAFSRHKVGVAINTADAAEEAAKNVRKKIEMLENESFWEKIKKIFRGLRDGTKE